MRFLDYMKGGIWDLVLVVLLGMAMSYQLLNCFMVDPAIQYSVIPALVVIVASTVLVCISFSSRTRRLGGIVYGIVAILAIVACGASTITGIFVDNETNYLIVGMVLVITPTVVFLMSRTRTGSAFLFILCAFITAAVEFFYLRFELAWALIAVFSAIALIVYRNYQLSTRTATSVRKFSFVPGFLVSVGSVAVAIGLGVFVWFAVIAPLNPSAAQIKLITEYRALETKMVVGVSSEYQLPNTDLTSDKTSDGMRTTAIIKKDPEGDRYPANGDTPPEEESVDGESASFMGLSQDDLDEIFDQISYGAATIGPYVLIAVVLGLIIVYFIDRRVYRRTRLKKFQALGPTKQSEYLYLFLVDKMRILGLGVVEGQTPMEYARAINGSVQNFDARAGVNFRDLAGLYTTITYGKREASQEDADLFAAYYKSFWKSARKYLGNFKYFLKSFRLG